MDCIKGILNDSDKESDQTSRDERDIEGVPQRPRRSNKVAPIEQSIPMEEYPESEEDPGSTDPFRPKSRAVALPSDLIIGSDNDSSVHTSTLSSHSSDSFHPTKKVAELEGIEDVDTGLQLDDRKSSTMKRFIRTLGDAAARKRSSVYMGRRATLSLAQRKTLLRAEKVGMVEMKQLPFFTRIGYEFSSGVQRSTRKIQEGTRNFKVWGRSIKEVEGNLGSGVSTYFRVLRWLLKINTIYMLLALGAVVTPGIWMSQHHDHLPKAKYNKDDLVCLNPDFLTGTDKAAKVANSILQFLTGQGWMEATAMYLGWYPASNLTRHENGKEKTTYNFPLAYLLVGLVYFVVGLVFICNNIARLLKKSAVEKIETKVYSQLVLAGWDHTISNVKSAQLNSITIVKSLREELHNSHQKFVKRSLKQQIGILCVRVLTNCIAVGAMVGTIFLYYNEIVQVTSKAEANSKSINSCGQKITNETLVKLLQQGKLPNIPTKYITEKLRNVWSSYSASIIVSLSNIVFPMFFEVLGRWEFYKFQRTRVGITMLRSFVMKLFSVCVFLYALYQATKPSGGIELEKWQNESNTLFYNCWENYIGAQLYQLCIIDFIVFCVTLFFSEFVTSFLIRHVKWFRARIDQPEFSITEEVLGLCYKQMIFWSALFFAPLMSCVAVIEVIAIFYLKKASALANVRPPQNVVFTSRSSSMVTVNSVFLVSLFFIFIFLGLVIFKFTPSAHCGPFRGMADFSEPLRHMIANSGGFKTYIYDNLRMTAVIITAIIIVILVIYYFRSLAASHHVTVKLLRHQIKVEHVDKQFLIEHIKSQITGQPVAASQHPTVMSESSPGKLGKKKNKNKTIHRFANPTMA